MTAGTRFAKRKAITLPIAVVTAAHKARMPKTLFFKWLTLSCAKILVIKNAEAANAADPNAIIKNSYISSP